MDKKDLINKLSEKFEMYNCNNKISKSTLSNTNDNCVYTNINNTCICENIDRPNITYDWDKENHNILIHFGKNGLGLTNEFIEIGKFIEKLSNKAHVYIADAFIDVMDDVYDLTFYYEYK